MENIAITGSGLYTPQEAISNEELVKSFNIFVNQFNEDNKEKIHTGEVTPLEFSSAEFIYKASGIKSRYVHDKAGILDPTIMRPRNLETYDNSTSLQASISAIAAKEAMEKANISSNDLDAVIVACSFMQRPFPAIATEVQHELDIDGYAFDLNIACSSATFAIQNAVNAIVNKQARSILIVNPEVCSGGLNFRERDSHFIFGDACTAIIVQHNDYLQSNNAFTIKSIKLKTSFSNNIRSNYGLLNRTCPEKRDDPDKLFIQHGRKVFKEVLPFASKFISEHLVENNIQSSDISRLWLHQANITMNEYIARKILGHNPDKQEAPIILDEYANTASAGSIIAFHKYNQDLQSKDLGVLSSFGAGYSVGSVILEKI